MRSPAGEGRGKNADGELDVHATIHIHPNDAPCRPNALGGSARQAAPRGAGTRDTSMKTYQGTMTPIRRDLSDPRSSGQPIQAPRPPLLNDRRSTR